MEKNNIIGRRHDYLEEDKPIFTNIITSENYSCDANKKRNKDKDNLKNTLINEMNRRSYE